MQKKISIDNLLSGLRNSDSVAIKAIVRKITENKKINKMDVAKINVCRSGNASVDAFSVKLSNLLSKEKLTHSDYWVIEELERLTKIMSGEEDSGGLVGIAMVQTACDVTRPTLTTWRQRGFPDTQRKHAVPAYDLIRFLRRQWLEYQNKALNKSDDPLLFGGGESSPSLERYRGASADLKEMQVEEKKGELVRYADYLADMYQLLSGTWSQIRRMVEKLPPLIEKRKASEIRATMLKEINRTGRAIIKKMEAIKNEIDDKKKKA